ncbi:MAG: sigma 54-interacting transcriptional regulator [Nitrospiraceae bacterium]
MEEGAQIRIDLAAEERTEPFSMSWGKDEVTEDLQPLIAQAARSDAPILIQGGAKPDQEVVARLLHTQSRRAGGPFVAIHCDQVSRKLLEGELFGYETDSSTGVTGTKPGLLAAAETGTLFFNDLGVLSGPTQIGLLRFLEQGAYQPVQSQRRLRADVRIVGATNQDLQALVLQGRFSDDLLYRITTITLRIPSLSAQVLNQNRTPLG